MSIGSECLDWHDMAIYIPAPFLSPLILILTASLVLNLFYPFVDILQCVGYPLRSSLSLSVVAFEVILCSLLLYD
jgi:hypothetical protein